MHQHNRKNVNSNVRFLITPVYTPISPMRSIKPHVHFIPQRQGCEKFFLGEKKKFNSPVTYHPRTA